MNARAAILITIFCTCLFGVRAQTGNYINLNNQDGLPSNYVYSVITDGHGYLWMATTKGVVQYNGYSFRVYTIADGLPHDDVWGLHCDRKGRIWLRTIARKLGYIYNNRYHSAYQGDIDMLLYPAHIADYDSGIMFTTRVDTVTFLLVEKNDTLRNYGKLGSRNIGLYTCGSNLLWYISARSVSKLSYSDKVGLRRVSSCNFKMPLGWGNFSFTNIFDKYFFWHNVGGDSLLLYNSIDCSSHDFRFGEGVQFADYDANSLYAITDNYIHKIDKTARLVAKYPLKALPGIGAEEISGTVTNCFEDAFWGRWITTSGTGVWFLPRRQNNIQPAVNLNGYKLAGMVADSVSYWWNNSSKTLLRLDHAGRQVYRLYPGIRDLRCIGSWNAQELLFLSFDVAYLLNDETGQLRKLPLPAKQIVSVEDSLSLTSMMTATRQVLPLSDSNTIIVSRSGGVFTFRAIHDTVFSEKVNTERIQGIVYDNLRKGLWMYETFSIAFQHDTGRRVHISNRMLEMMGLHGIEKVVADKYGNLFVKDHNRMYEIDITGHSIHSLFSGYNLKDMRCHVLGDHIILAGEAGVLFSRIRGIHSFSDPVFYPNIKNSLYGEVEDVAVLRDKVLLNTDRHTYEVAIPSDSMFEAVERYRPKYKVLAYYRGNAMDLNVHQQITIDQENPVLQFDVINPEGSGLLRYACKVEDSAWRQLTTSELYLPRLKPGRQYRLWLRLHDDVWRSNSLPFTVFVQPYWYQTHVWRTIFIIAGILAVTALVVVVIVITRHYAAREEAKKRSLIQLELRAIYSQLNPHFIFNTLNSATYFIKKGMYDAALEHVSKFAILLRRYLESTRNRHILLSDEISNLRSYIELQQVRFGNKFSYAISIDDGIRASTVRIPTLLIQPFVENAINHGLVPKDEPGNLNILFRKGTADKEIICIVSDDGIGRQQSARHKQAMPMGKQSYGDDMITELVYILNKYERAEITIDYTDNQPPETGTVVVITIKNPLYE